MTDTTAATIRIVSLDRARAGRILALATVEIDIAGVVILLHGLRVAQAGPGVVIEAPQHRLAASGAWVRSIELPDDLAEAVADLVADTYFGR